MTRWDRHRVRPGRGRVAVPALVSGVGLALSLPPWGLWALAFPSAGLLWWRLGGLRPRTRLWAGWIAGLGCYIPSLEWTHAFTLAGAAVLIAFEAAFTALACVAVPAGPISARAFAFPAAMTLAEAVRTAWPFGGLPIGGVFLGQAGGPLLGVVRLGGPLGLTATVYLGGVGLGALGEITVRTVGDARRARALAAAVAVGATLALAIAGVLAPDGGPPIGHLTTAAVQGGGARGYSMFQIDPSTVLAAQMAATARMQERDHESSPALVLWPEDAVALDTLLNRSPEEEVLSGLARALRTTFVVGVTEVASPTAFFNEIVAFGPNGRIAARYEKVHRVPFGEYVPYRGLLSHLFNLSSVPRDAIPGRGNGLLPTPAAPLGAMISYEVFYADRGRSAVRAGAQLLIVPTNTASYATNQVPTQELAASKIQAVEQGRDLLQAASTGYSAAITNRGTVLDRSTLGVPAVVFASLSLRTGQTLYVRYGDLPVDVLAVVALIVAWWLGAGRRPGADRD